MRRPKYPLEPLVEVRRRKVDDAAGHLGVTMRERAAAEQARSASESKRLAHASAAERARAVERAALEQGRLRASDLARSDAWEARVAVEQSELASGVERARAREDGARAGEDRARGDLGLRRTEARLIGHAKERWDDERRRRDEAREEDASADAWRSPKP